MAKPMAMCPTCSIPLISTCAFPKAEFYCLQCGAHLGFMSPDSADMTPEIEFAYTMLEAEWKEHAGPKLIVPRSWYSKDRCEECGPDSPHELHATNEEREADVQARRWLQERVGKGVAA